MKSPADMHIIQIDITNACHKKCSNCTRFVGHHRKPFMMDFETFKRAVDSMAGFTGIVGIMGGEPTLHPEFERFATYFRDAFGRDDRSAAAYKPQANFVTHIMDNVFDLDHHNQRGLWTSVTPKYYEHFELIQDTFGYQAVNDHSNPSFHETLMVTRKELGVSDAEWIPMRDKCWIQNRWSASITPKGAFFCEVAAALDMTFDGPGGWPIEPGWWKRKPEDFGDQLQWCEMCSAPLPMPKRNANEEVDDASPVWYAKLRDIGSPKMRKGLVNEFDPQAHDPSQYEVIDENLPYMPGDQTQRIGAGNRILTPQDIRIVVELNAALPDEAARRVLADNRAVADIALVVSDDPARETLAREHGLPFLATAGKTGQEAFTAVRTATGAQDWVLLLHGQAVTAEILEVFRAMVFNPGCLYGLKDPVLGRSRAVEFFNLRAHSLRLDADFFNLRAHYPREKVQTVNLSTVSAPRFRDAI